LATTQIYITKKLDENVAIKVSTLGFSNMAKSSIFDEIFDEICVY